jgi:hypothetical protein
VGETVALGEATLVQQEVAACVGCPLIPLHPLTLTSVALGKAVGQGV